ncbi:MAG: pentapeptide repeat-containing protein [Syntrophomonadaceae bacterium]|nr:pentapeptide repeat-containing protein [Syntrophomonadaceae bacterium]
MEPGDNSPSLKADCSNCCGICCVALYFSSSEGFPQDKKTGDPCRHLQPDSRCAIYSKLQEQELKGCMAFDCFGAGQKVTTVSFAGLDWRKSSELAQAMFDVFLIMRHLHEMQWYLSDALRQSSARPIYRDLQDMLKETEEVTLLSPSEIIGLDMDALRGRVNKLLLITSELVRTNTFGAAREMTKKKMRRGALLMGADLRKHDLRGANLRGSCLIAADFRGADLTAADLIGADFRDTDIRGTNLSRSLFFTQSQVNAARGDHSTRLPEGLEYPRWWPQ